MVTVNKGTLTVAAGLGFLNADAAFALQPLADGLTELGWDVELSNARRLKKAFPLISINGHGLRYRSGSRKKIAMVVMEPRVTLPSVSRLARHAGSVWWASPQWSAAYGGNAIRWPQVLDLQSAHQGSRPNGDYPYSATLINADKRSADFESLYGLRRQVVEMARRMEYPVAIVGLGWDDSRLRKFARGLKAIGRHVLAGQRFSIGEAMLYNAQPASSLGFLKSKRDALGLAPISIVIENSLDYLSEKVFDVISSGCVPVYVGPNLEDYGIPEELVARASPDASEIINACVMLDEVEISRLRQLGDDWLHSHHVHHHSSTMILKKLAVEIDSWLISEQGGPSRGRAAIEEVE